MLHVLRLGHRRARDARMTTHVCLTARALGADMVHVETEDAELERAVRDVAERFGGAFEVRTGVPWRPLVRAWKGRGGLVAHLTMYGEPLDAAVGRVSGRDVLVVVGAEKVPADLYGLADVNVAVGNQPHSEVAALALFLDRVTQGAWAGRRFGGTVEVVPNPRGKTLIGPSRSTDAASKEEQD